MVSNSSVYVLDGVSLEYKVERKRVKNARIEVKPWGLLVVLPLFGVNALSLLEKNKNWIVKVYGKLKERERLYNSPPDRFPIFGVEYNIRVDENLNGFEIDENNRVIKLGYRFSPVELKNFFKTLLLNKILTVLENLPSDVDKAYNKIMIKTQKTRWASCSTNRNLNFNIKMVSLPLKLLEYIVYHELIHFKIKSHSYAFYKIIAGKYPDYRRLRRELNECFIKLNMNRLWRFICQTHFSKQTISSSDFLLVGLGSKSG